MPDGVVTGVGIAAAAPGRTLKGYRQRPRRPGSDPAPASAALYDGMIAAGPVSLDGMDSPVVFPAIAAVLRHDVPPAQPPGAVHRATGGAFLALEIADEGGSPGVVVLGERLFELPLSGGLRLSGPGADTADYPAADFGDTVDRVAAVADEVGGLAGGHTVVLAVADAPHGRPVGPGTVDLWGPDGTTLTVRLERARVSS